MPPHSWLIVDCYHGAHNDNAEHEDYVKVHTDFFALKPSALPPNAFLIPKTNNAEKSFTAEIQSMILKVGGAPIDLDVNVGDMSSDTDIVADFQKTRQNRRHEC